MARIVRCSLIQAKNVVPVDIDGAGASLAAIKQPMIEKHIAMIRAAVADGAQIVCLQEIFNGPYFCAEQTTRWHNFAERIPDGPTVQLMMQLARELGVALVVPIYEVEVGKVEDGEAEGGKIFYNSAAVIGRDGAFLGKYRKAHIPHAAPGFWEKFYFSPGNLGFPVFDLGFCRIGVYLCYDRHFPEGARVMGLNGAEIVFNPSATSRGLSAYLWQLEQPASAVANEYFVGAINRVGVEELGTNDFYGQSYFVNPRGQFVGDVASTSDEELIVRDLDMDLLKEVREQWAFYRDRRPDMYEPLTDW